MILECELYFYDSSDETKDYDFMEKEVVWTKSAINLDKVEVINEGSSGDTTTVRMTSGESYTVKMELMEFIRMWQYYLQEEKEAKICRPL